MPSHNIASALFQMDFEMPLLRGPEATQQIRKMGFNRTILGVTGNVLAEDVKFFVSQGANEVLAKPISMDMLQSCWERYPLVNQESSTGSLRRNKWSFSWQNDI